MQEIDDALYEEPETFLYKLNHPMSMTAIMGDTMYLHQAIAHPNMLEFINAMLKELDTHQKRKHWVITPIQEVTKGMTILDLVWAMRRKSKIGTGEISKYKARLNAHGGQ